MPPAEPNWTHLQIPPIVPGSLSASPPRVGAVSDRSPTSVQLTDRSLRFDHREARCAEGHCDSPLLRNEVEETPGGDDDVEVVTSMKTRHPWEVYHTPIRMSRGQPPGEESLSPMRFPTSIIVHCQRYETMRSWRFLVFKRNVRPHLFVHYDYE